MKEIASTVGAERNLVAVLTLPETNAKPLAVILFNAGVVHRIGPHRINVKLARALARTGYLCARVDLAGRGESRAPARAAPFGEQAVDDIRAVMDHVARENGIERFALCGICSGAENAHATALADERVAGAFLLDGPVYATFRSRALKHVWRLRSVTRGRLGRWLRNLPSRLSAGSTNAGAAPVLPPPTRAEFAAGMATLVARGVRVTLAFTASGGYRYTAQMADAFRGHAFVERIACHYTPAIDHLVTPLAAQRRYIALVEEWLASIDTERP